MSADPHSVLRVRLVETQRNLIAEMVANGCGAGMGGLLAGIAAAVTALDEEPGTLLASESGGLSPSNGLALSSTLRHRCAPFWPTTAARWF